MAQWKSFEAIHNINDKNSPVKLKIQKNTDSLQFKRWFDHSKVVNANGEPLVVYHGTDWQRWEFNTDNGACFLKKEDYAEEMAAQRKTTRLERAICLCSTD